MRGSLADAIYQGGEAAAEPELLRLMSRIQDANARLVKMADHMENVGDRLFGPRPKAVPGANGATPMPSGTVPMLGEAIDALHSRITDAEDAFSRIGCL